ncbi:MAG: hypothetical protein IPP83_02495 [Flavobacteriales bacterium]|nr:hypothetical protein [Flavobacteriales bacterium]MBL0126329.1 hypothetical protein [Flavobacteriales bacterium]MCC6936973.1 hypothetical protein [Flavobacteriales bacterium]
MKKTILSFALLGVCSIASAQLSTRENQDTRYKFGGRPVAGDMALTFGITINNTEIGGKTVPAWNLFSRGNLITAKKYIRDDVAIRAGIALYRDSRSIKGDVDSIPGQPWTNSAYEFKSAQRQYMFVPGIEKHFSSSNIFDVYTAGDLFLGFGRDKSIDSQTNTDSQTSSMTKTTPYTIVGLGGVIGVNVFVLDLPISVGVEYGMSAFWMMGNKTKVEVEEFNGTSYEYFTVEDANNLDGSAFSGNGAQYSSVKQKYMRMDSNDQVRMVVNIYFN